MKQSKKNLKPIPSTMRGKKRYIKFLIEALAAIGSPLKEKDVYNAVWGFFLKKFGSLGIARQRFLVVAFDEKTGMGVLRCSHKSVEKTKKALLELNTVKDIAVKTAIIRVSGSINKLKNKRHAKKKTGKILFA